MIIMWSGVCLLVSLWVVKRDASMKSLQFYVLSCFFVGGEAWSESLCIAEKFTATWPTPAITCISGYMCDVFVWSTGFSVGSTNTLRNCILATDVQV